jgi:signal transduction histidine kinase/ligand-binding sensor domain-containing protein/CheY-like chemotaxis protein
MIFKKGWLICGWLFFILLLKTGSDYSSSTAQITGLNFRYLTTKDGLSSDVIYDIYQDKDGFMWFATDGGLDRYDGRNFVNLFDSARDTTSFANQITYSIVEDSYHGIWFSSGTNGLMLYDKMKEKFRRFSHSDSDTKSLSNNNVRCVFEDSRNNLWIATLGGGLNLFNRKDSTFSHFLFDSTRNNSIGSNKITSIAEDREGILWLASRNNNLLIRFDPVKQLFENILVDSSFRMYRNNMNVPVVCISYDDNIWYGIGRTLYQYDKKRKQLTGYDVEMEHANRMFSEIMAIREIDNQIVFTTTEGGLYIFNPVTHKFTNVAYNVSQPSGINSNQLSCLFQSREGVIWIGSFNEGINIYSGKSLRFPRLMNLVDIKSLEFSTFPAYSICEPEAGKILIGTSTKGILLFDVAKNSIEKIIPELQHNGAYHMFYDHGQIWMSSVNGGLFCYDWKTKKLTHIDHLNKNAFNISDRVVRFVKDRNNRIWLGYINKGLVVINGQSGTTVNYKYDPKNPNSLSNNFVFKIYQDKKGHIWVGTASGLNLFDERDGKFTRVPLKNENGNLVYDLTIYDVFEDEENRIWIGTNKSLYLYNAGTKSGDPFLFKENGVPITILSILEDNNHTLWLGTGNGICSYKPEIRKFRYYGTSDAINFLTIFPEAGVKSKSGIIYFGTSKGVIVVDPARIKDDNFVPPVFITELDINDQPVKLGMTGLTISKSILYTDYIKLKYSQSTLSISFAALNYCDPKSNQFLYKLSGYDQDWIKANYTNTAHYVHLPPGKYVFKVIAANSHGVWNKTGKEMIIIITPPIWRTWWFRIGVALILIIAAGLFYYNHIHQLERQKKHLEILVDKRTRQLNEANKALTEQREELIQQHEEISSQNDMLAKMSNEILAQNQELEGHREHLEKLVKERTRELQEALKKAEEADKLKSAFLANMSHEIRTPMNAIVGFANLLKDSDIDEAEKTDFIEVINSNSEILLILIDDILDLSLIEANQLVIRKDIFSLNEILDHLYSSFSLMNRKQELEMRLNNELHGNNLKIFSDRIRIKQILSNLLNNAYKFTEKGSIELGVRKLNNNISFYVKDTGIGIEKGNLEKIFDRFSKSDPKSDTLYRGAGLGLTISKALAGLLGGSLQVESEVGVGSVFYFNLPYSLVSEEEVAAIPFKTSENTQELSDKNILIVEDEQANYLYAKKMLNKMYINVYWAENGLEALNLASSGVPFDLILMDIKMPLMDGFEAAKIIKSNNPKQIIIALTAYARPEDRARFMEAGFDDYLSKPIKPNDFKSVIRRYVS